MMKAMHQKNPKKKYPGRLGKPTPPSIFHALLYGYDNWRGDLEAELLIELCKHYDISATIPNRWLLLALRLAREHVPAFQIKRTKGVGRPRKPDHFPTGEKRGVGRPKIEDSTHKLLLNLVNKEIQENGLSGRGAIKSALQKMWERYARKNQKNAAWVRAAVKATQKEYSRAAALFPEISYKYQC